MKIVKRLLFTLLLAIPNLLLANSAIDTNTTTKINININTATKKELMAIKGVGEVKADRIIEERDIRIFCSLTDFADRVEGIGEKTIDPRKNNLTVGDIKDSCLEKP
uniref:Competence protein ComEA helix-hairpin-helix repeat region n=1 Tax=Candidatus Kentrum sp. FW TaxID=2126338 RepID=A0A450TX16_9GAMM|nr:MAG: competence protein ComEA helix-hairpin-helix repeat region [Candidatus Kentron sp. FW]